MLKSHLHSKYQLQPGMNLDMQVKMSELLHLAWDSRAAFISTFGFALLILCNYALILFRMPELTSSFQVGRCTATFFAIYLRHRFCFFPCVAFKTGVAKVVDIDPLGSMGLSKGSIKA
ncbi:hypothetical protein T12_8997 [Trichinella patagoniensis]|uniref:Uncharacterized protein n=1 Tax=Trichinella patagoniensis TaxID=990121 RepID=A0A0V1ACM2_9BILA|nr:hypothetical protein T12_8997 [Trichinella patagoniensis]